MNQKRRNGSRAIAALLLFAIVQIGLQVGFAEPNHSANVTALPQQVVGRLTTQNNQPVTVNGISANTGASILSGATIETGADQSATVDLGPLGSLEIAQNTRVVFTFDEQHNVKANVILGCVVLTAKSGAIGEVTTEKGSVGKTDPSAGGVLNNCTAPSAPPGQSGGGNGGLFGLGRAATIAILGGAGAAALTPLFFQDNPSGSNP
jgi:hypothetical protein